MDDFSERLIRLEAKLDGIQSTLDVRLTHMESAQKHERANREAADQALKVEIDKKASREEVEVIADIAKAARDAISKIGWTVALAVLGAVLALVLGGQVA